MLTFLIVFLLVDALILLYLYKLAFVERSNMAGKNRRRFFLLLTVVAISLALYRFHPPLACLLAGIPACLVSVFVIALGIAMLTHKGPWR